MNNLEQYDAETREFIVEDLEALIEELSETQAARYDAANGMVLAALKELLANYQALITSDQN